MRLLHHYKDVTKINFERVQLTSELSLSKANKAFISPFGTIPLIRWFQLFHYTYNFILLSNPYYLVHLLLIFKNEL
jgi:hypothetical protein